MKTVRPAIALLALAISSTIANAQTVNLSDNEKQYVLQQARDLQYSLRTAGLEEMRCQVRPDWNGFFTQLGIDTTGPQSLVPLLERVHFNVIIDANGSVTVSHTGVPSPNAGTAAALRGALQGMNEVIASFFKTWAMYTINSPLPPTTSAYEVSPVDEYYVVRYQQDRMNVRTTLDSEFAIAAVSYRSPELSIDMRPSWSTGTYGYLLAAYEGVTQMTPGSTSSEQLQVSYRVERDFQLPASVRETLVTPKGNIQVSLEVAEYQLKTRNREKATERMRASSAMCGNSAR